LREKVDFLGRTINSDGVEMGDHYTKAVQDWPVPPNVKAVERFLKFANYDNRNFIAVFFNRRISVCSNWQGPFPMGT
jgi:hypothetical protein